MPKTIYKNTNTRRLCDMFFEIRDSLRLSHASKFRFYEGKLYEATKRDARMGEWSAFRQILKKDHRYKRTMKRYRDLYGEMNIITARQEVRRIKIRRRAKRELKGLMKEARVWGNIL